MSSPRSPSAGFEHVHPPNAEFWRSPHMYNQYAQQSPPNSSFAQEQHYQGQDHPGHARGQSSISQFPPILPPIPRVASKLDSSTAQARQRSTHGSQELGQLSLDDDALRHSLSSDQPSYLQFPMAATGSSLSPVQSTPSPSPSSSSVFASTSQLPPRLSRRSVTSPDGSFLKASSPRDSVSPSSAGSPSLANSASSATLGVPYSSTMARDKPTSGNRPLPPTSTLNGVPQHFSKTQKQRPEIPPPSKSKTRLNLLNPVNLLMRRRSSQAVETLSDKASAKNLIVPPMDLPDGYDPRIKGNKVHDFSAPKPRRNHSYNDVVGSPPQLDLSFSHDQSSLEPIQQSPPDLSRVASDEWNHQRRRSSQHIPVFTENFDSPTDERGPSAIQAETLANRSFIARNSWQNEHPVAMPPFGRKSQQLDAQQVQAVISSSKRESDPSSISSRSDASPLDSSPRGLGFRISGEPPVSPDTVSTVDSRPLSKEMHVIEQASSSSPFIEQPSSPPERKSPDSADDQFLSVNDNLSRRSGGLKHLPSSASRFSFQIASLDSMAEEKLLEDKHKQRHSTQQAESVGLVEDDEDEDEDEDEDFFDEDAMYDHDEMEGLDEPEVLGGNNVFQQSHNQRDPTTGLAASVAGFHFSDARPSFQAAASPPTSPQPSQSAFSMTPSHHMQGIPESNSPIEQGPRSPPFQLASEDMPAKPTSPMSTHSFYFDDGMIDPLDDLGEGPADSDGHAFNEDQFDDPSFLKKPQAPAQEESTKETALGSHQLGHTPSTYNVNGYDFLMHNEPQSSMGNFISDSPYSEDSIGQHERINSAPQHQEPFRHDSHSQHGRDQLGAQDSLSAYHSALAEAAQKAAADGRFTRHTSTATSNSTYSNAEEEEGPTDIHPDNETTKYARFAPEVTHISRPSYSGFDFGFQGGSRESPTRNDTFPLTEVPSDEFGYHFPPDDDDYDFDDAEIIAAANAEALAADDSGLYSQEFGFYARPRPGSADGEADINGGYFGQPGIEIQRQKSLREPNLTPITERSEFSTRNSYIAGPGGMPGMGRPWSPMSFQGSVQGLPSPALSSTMLAHQRGMSPLARAQIPENENMTLAEIRKGLHANAYGGSVGSLGSFGSDFNQGLSSPVGEYGAGFNYSPGHANNMPTGMPGANYYQPSPRGFPHGMGGVPMAWQRSADSNYSHPPSHPSHSYSSSIDVPSSPMPLVMAATNIPLPAAPAPSQAVQAEAFSFFDAGDDSDNDGSLNPNVYHEASGSNMVTPRKPASTPHSGQGPASFPHTPPTARKGPPAAIPTPGYMGLTKPSLGSPLKAAAYPPAPSFSSSPFSASPPAATFATAPATAAASGNNSPLASPPSPVFGGPVGRRSGVEHMRTGSGADTTCYVHERDTSGTKRWVLERRRTSELGFSELIGREVIEGGI